MPIETDGIKISYNAREMQWVADNERFIWQYFIENELLYKTQATYFQRFMEPSPFSKFYLEIDNESPGKIGQWLGWQIVRKYMRDRSCTQFCFYLDKYLNHHILLGSLEVDAFVYIYLYSYRSLVKECTFACHG